MRPTFEDALRKLRMAGERKQQLKLIEFYYQTCGRRFAQRLEKAMHVRGYQ